MPSEAILERIADTKVKRHILPLKVMNPSLTNRIAWVVKLKTEVDTKDDKCCIDTKAKTGVEA